MPLIQAFWVFLLFAFSPLVVAQNAASQKTKPPSKAFTSGRTVALTPQVRASQAADVTARLQAQAIAAAAARAPALAPAVASPAPMAIVVPTAAASAPMASAWGALPAASAKSMVADQAVGLLMPLPAIERMTQPVAGSAAAALAPAPTPPLISNVTGPNVPVATWSIPPQVVHEQPAIGSAAADLASQELAIAQRIHQGVLPCERGTSVTVQADASSPGYFRVMGKGFRYRMRPVPTSTGVLRLEDAQAGTVWLQLANKSMLMDQKKGRRLADDCAHPDQVAFAHGMKTNPPPMLFDTRGMGRSKD